MKSVDKNIRSRRKKQRPMARDLAGKVAEAGAGYGWESLQHRVSQTPSAGLYGRPSSHSIHRARHYFDKTPRSEHTKRSSRFSQASSSVSIRQQNLFSSAAHVVCSVSENLARETCVASLDAAAPTYLQVTKQGNGQTYAETIAYLEVLQPDEILLNEGRRTSQLSRKILELVRDTEPHGIGAQNDRYGTDTAAVVKFISRSSFDQTKGAELLRKVIREESYDATMVEEYILLSSAFALLNYTQNSLGASFTRNSVQLSVNTGGNNRMAIDRSTLLKLELLVNAKTGKVKDSLIGNIDNTKTTVGSRLLRTNIMSPPTQVDTINSRLDVVDVFLGNEDLFYNVMEHLAMLPDIDKMLTNVALKPLGNIKEGKRSLENDIRMASRGISALVGIKTTLSALPSLARTLEEQLQVLDTTEPLDDNTIRSERTSLLLGLGGHSQNQYPISRHHLLRAILFALNQPALNDIREVITDALSENATFSRNSLMMRHQECFALKSHPDDMMSIFRSTFNANVDEIYRKADEYAETYGFHVHVKYTSSRGYYLAVPSDIINELPHIFLQPRASGRYFYCTSEEVASLNTRARDNVHDLLLMTHDKIQEILDLCRQDYDALAAVGDAIALLDMCHSFADTVTLCSFSWCRPCVTEQPVAFNIVQASSDHSCSLLGRSVMIRNGRYCIDVGPIETDGVFVPNDTHATADKPFTLISGINGSGKSTYLKQIGIIVILAHCGSYVPADEARIPILSRLCTRIGNADDQEHNISTFMLEMKETAYLCNNCTDKSLILIDELGRATSNEDGVALAWSLAEYLLKKRAIAFFVTHYPNLSHLANIYPQVQNVHLHAAVSREDEDRISYMHKVMPGPCSILSDYGIKLARNCGWKRDVVDRARHVQSIVEELLPDEMFCEPQAEQCKSDLILSQKHIFEKLKQMTAENEISKESRRDHLANIMDFARTQPGLANWLFQFDHMALSEASHYDKPDNNRLTLPANNFGSGSENSSSDSNDNSSISVSHISSSETSFCSLY